MMTNMICLVYETRLYEPIFENCKIFLVLISYKGYSVYLNINLLGLKCYLQKLSYITFKKNQTRISAY